MKRPSLLTTARKTLLPILAGGDENAPPTRILVGVSGGGDSLALLHVLSLLRDKLNLELVAIGVDHGLRPEARDELELARKLAAEWAVPYEIVEVEVRGSGNVQAKARDVRMAALEGGRVRHGCAFVATAHHADDRAETFLIRLLAGGTAAALGVLPARDHVRIRPLIEARKMDILLHLTRNGIPYADDRSNRDPRYLRVRVRQELLPLLESFNPNIVSHLVDLAEELGMAEPPNDALEQVLARVEGPHSKRVRTALAALPAQARGARVALPGGLVARFDRTHSRYVIEKAPSAQPSEATGDR